jgi:hypothetical protein
MNEDKIKGKNHSFFSFFSITGIIKERNSIRDGKKGSNGERIIRKTATE